MIVIGDAAHAPAPTSGQGAPMAIEDAIALAGELARAASIELAFAAYERFEGNASRRSSPGAHVAAATRCPAIRRIARDAMLRILFRWVITEKSLGWMYDYRIGLARPAAPHGANLIATPSR